MPDASFGDHLGVLFRVLDYKVLCYGGIVKGVVEEGC